MDQSNHPTPPSNPRRTGGAASAATKIIIGVVLIAGLLYIAASHKSAVKTADAAAASGGVAILNAPQAAGLQAPAWTLRDVQGRPVSLKQFAGHPVVMDFWATWCGPCKVEMPWWEQMQKQYRDRGLVIVGVSEDLKFGDLKSFLAQNPVNYQIVWGGDDSALAQAYGEPYGLPTTLFINRQGKIVKRVLGLEPEPELDKDIREIL